MPPSRMTRTLISVKQRFAPPLFSFFQQVCGLWDAGTRCGCEKAPLRPEITRVSRLISQSHALVLSRIICGADHYKAPMAVQPRSRRVQARGLVFRCTRGDGMGGLIRGKQRRSESHRNLRAENRVFDPTAVGAKMMRIPTQSTAHIREQFAVAGHLGITEFVHAFAQ